MMAAAAASSLALRLRQSDSRTDNRDSASRLDRRSSCSTTGMAILRFDRARKGLDVFRLIGRRSVEAARPADHDSFETIIVVGERGDFLDHEAKGFGFRRRTLHEPPRRCQGRGGITQRETNAPGPIVDAQHTHTSV